MTVTADTVRLGIIRETTKGVVPTNPAFQSLRLTGESVAFTPNVVNSAELTPGRGVADSALVGATAAGDLSWELSKNAAFELLLAGMMASDWGDLLGFTSGQMPVGWDTTWIGVGKKIDTFSFLKEFDVNGDGSLLSLQTFPDLMVNTFQLTITPNQIITGSFGVQSGTMTVREAEYTGQSFVAPGVNPVFTAPKVVTAEFRQLDQVTPLGIGIGNHCFNNLVINLTNNIRAVECIGQLGAREYALGKCEVTLTAGIYFADDLLLNMLIDQSEFSMLIKVADGLASPNNHSYEFWVPRAKLTAAGVTAGGTGQDVVAACSIACLVPSVIPNSPLKVRRITA